MENLGKTFEVLLSFSSLRLWIWNWICQQNHLYHVNLEKMCVPFSPCFIFYSFHIKQTRFLKSQMTQNLKNKNVVCSFFHLFHLPFIPCTFLKMYLMKNKTRWKRNPTTLFYFFNSESFDIHIIGVFQNKMYISQGDTSRKRNRLFK